MRPIWKGSISFGLVNIPINLYSATEENEISFDLLHEKDFSRIRYARICKKEEKEVPYDQIVKGYNYYEDKYVVLNDEDFKKADLKKSTTIEIQNFSDLKDINTVYYEKPYYIESQKDAEKSFELLRQALQQTDKVGIAKFVLRNKEHLLALKPEGNHLIINQLRFKEEIREIKNFEIPKVSLRPEEIELAVSLIDKLTKKFSIENYHDTYTENLKNLIVKKSKGQEIRAIGREPKATDIEDLMETLRKSLIKTK